MFTFWDSFFGLVRGLVGLSCGVLVDTVGWGLVDVFFFFKLDFRLKEIFLVIGS